MNENARLLLEDDRIVTSLLQAHVTLDGQERPPVSTRPELAIRHRLPRLRSGIGSASHGKPAEQPDPAKRALRAQRNEGLSARQQRKQMKAMRRAAKSETKS